MDDEFDAVDASSSRGSPERDDVESESETERLDRRAILTPAVQSVIAALGGFEDGEYVLGDEAYGCLKDLKKYWRKDDTDDDRTVARIFWDSRVMFNDLLPILHATAGKGQVDHRCAIAVLDLITAMTWPIDLASELMELDEAEDSRVDYTTLLHAHLHYKSAILGTGVLESVIAILLPCLAKEKRDRTTRDQQIMHVALYLFRNLAYIKDPPYRPDATAETEQLMNLQSKMVLVFKEENIFEMLLTFASNSTDDPLMNSWNTLLLETFYLVFRAVKPDSVVADQKTQASQKLASLLASEGMTRTAVKRHAPTRHSRFGTSITVKQGNQKWNLHKQQAIQGEVGGLLDLSKKRQTKKAKVQDELGTFDSMSYDARVALQSVAETFIQSCFNAFLTGLLKDIRAERPKVTEKDNLRLLFLTKWFMEYFLGMHTKEAAAVPDESDRQWRFELVADIVERAWIAWILKRMRVALDEKPKQWTELQAGLECMTHLLLLIEAMSKSNEGDLVDAADALQHQVYYNGEIMDMCFDALKTYKDQSIAYLHATVHCGYVLLRMLEAWGKSKGEMYIQRRKGKKKKRKAQGNANEELGILEDANEEPAPEGDSTVYESIMSFDKYELKFADEDICHTLLVYLAQFRQFDSPRCLKRVVTLLHRQAVRVKAEGLFFKVTTLNLFRSILDDNKAKLLPNDSVYQDLLKLINFILRKFFKAVQEDKFLLVEAFFPKNRGGWKQFSSWEPPPKRTKPEKPADGEDEGEVSLGKRFTWSQQVGIAVGCLVEADRLELVKWTQEILMMAMSLRQQDVNEEESEIPGAENDADDDPTATRQRTRDVRPPPPPKSAIDKFEDYVIPYSTNEKAQAATRNSYLKLLWNLLRFESREQTGDELEWYVPRSEYPDALEASLQTISNYLRDPIDVNGKRPKQLLSKKRKRRIRESSESDGDSSAGEERKLRKQRKKKEAQIYKSAAIIEDSDEELGDDQAFFEKERAQRERYAVKASNIAQGDDAPRGGTKKKKGSARKRRKTSPTSAIDVDVDVNIDDPKESDFPDNTVDRSESRRPQESRRASTPLSSPPKASKPASSRAYPEAAPLSLPLDSEDEAPVMQTQARRPRRVLLSDEED